MSPTDTPTKSPTDTPSKSPTKFPTETPSQSPSESCPEADDFDPLVDGFNLLNVVKFEIDITRTRSRNRALHDEVFTRKLDEVFTRKLTEVFTGRLDGGTVDIQRIQLKMLKCCDVPEIFVKDCGDNDDDYVQLTPSANIANCESDFEFEAEANRVYIVKLSCQS
jgi:hypothetical protein